MQGIIQINLSSTLAASVGFAPLSIAQASLTLLSLIAKSQRSTVNGQRSTLLPSVVILATFGNWNKFHCTHLSQEVALQINTDFYSMEINDITYKIRGAIFAVYNALGPGLLESVYELALMHELSKQGLKVDCATPMGSGE